MVCVDRDQIKTLPSLKLVDQMNIPVAHMLRLSRMNLLLLTCFAGPLVWLYLQHRPRSSVWSSLTWLHWWGLNYVLKHFHLVLKAVLVELLVNSYIEIQNVCSVNVERVWFLERSSILFFEQRRKLFPCVSCY